METPKKSGVAQKAVAMRPAPEGVPATARRIPPSHAEAEVCAARSDLAQARLHRGPKINAPSAADPHAQNRYRRERLETYGAGSGVLRLPNAPRPD